MVLSSMKLFRLYLLYLVCVIYQACTTLPLTLRSDKEFSHAILSHRHLNDTSLVPTIQHPPLSSSNIVEETPVLDLKRLPDLRRILHRVLNQLPLQPNLQIDLLDRVLALDMRHVDANQDIRALLLQSDQIQHDGGEVWRGLPAAVAGGWGLRCDERVGWDFFAVCRSGIST